MEGLPSSVPLLLCLVAYIVFVVYTVQYLDNLTHTHTAFHFQVIAAMF